MSSKQTDEDSLAAFRDELVEQIPHLRAFARSLADSAEAADDLTQEALAKAWKARDSFEPGTNMKAWTFMILRNHFYSQKRRAWRNADWDEEKAERSLTETARQHDVMDLDDLAHAMTRLPEEQREALILIGAGGFSYEEAATICDCAVGTIKSRVNRARAALEELMKETAPEGRSDDSGAAADSKMQEIMQEADSMAREAGLVPKNKDKPSPA